MTAHHTTDPYADIRPPDPHQDTFSKVVLGFWTYLMTDCVLFATLFTTHAVLQYNTFGGPSFRELFDLSDAFIETMLLLFSSVTCGFGMLAAVKGKKQWAMTWFLSTFAFGAGFIGMELREFTHLVQTGNSWTRSAALSSFFTLVGTHGLHVSVGLFWMGVMIAQLAYQGITIDTFRRLVVFSLFWHFLDVVWIFIFTFVYLMGVI